MSGEVRDVEGSGVGGAADVGGRGVGMSGRYRGKRSGDLGSSF